MLMRNAIGEVLRTTRLEKRLTMREISATACVSLGHISEVERGYKEASSELLASIADALGVPLGTVIIDAGLLMLGNYIPDTVEALTVDDYADLVAR